MSHDERCRSANRFGDGFDCICGEPSPFGRRPNESEVPAPYGGVAIIVPDPATVHEALPQCEACAGFERHNAHQCARTAPHDVSGVKLCEYHESVRHYAPVLYLADGRGMNRAGVVGKPPAQPTEPAAGIVDALVSAADRIASATAISPAGPVGHYVEEPPRADGTVNVFAYDGFDAITSGDPTDLIAALNQLMPTTAPPPSEAEPEPRACVPPPAEPVPVPPFMSTDSATRKCMPVASGFLAYFPDAVMLASMISVNGANKHCGGVLGWDKSKSADEPDAEVRHMLDVLRGLPPDVGLEELGQLGHYASKLWRAAADCQRACDRARAAVERGEDWRKCK